MLPTLSLSSFSLWNCCWRSLPLDLAFIYTVCSIGLTSSLLSLAWWRYYGNIQHCEWFFWLPRWFWQNWKWHHHLGSQFFAVSAFSECSRWQGEVKMSNCKRYWCFQVLGPDEQSCQVARRLNNQHHCSACAPLSLRLHSGTSRNSTLQRQVPEQLEKQLWRDGGEHSDRLPGQHSTQHHPLLNLPFLRY